MVLLPPGGGVVYNFWFKEAGSYELHMRLTPYQKKTAPFEGLNSTVCSHSIII